ncbi:MAG: hypothetical protein GXO78_13660 [Calditrichaeota bacterium]|nr:hypothetical protein [Calditrichota bacterium]
MKTLWITIMLVVGLLVFSCGGGGEGTTEEAQPATQEVQQQAGEEHPTGSMEEHPTGDTLQSGEQKTSSEAKN